MGKFACFFGLAAALCACGSDSSPGAIAGTVHGMTYAIHDSVSSEVSINTAGGVIHAGAVLMTTSSGLCPDVMAHQDHPNEKGATIALFDVVGTTTNAPTVPGTYSIYQGTGSLPPKAASFSTVVLDATCTEIAADEGKATTGTVTLTAVSGNKYTGNFDVALDSGDHVTGSFNPEECAQLGDYIGSSTMPACI
jgi:hypothetical protein